MRGMFPVAMALLLVFSCAMAQVSIQPIVGFGLGIGGEVAGTDYEENTEGTQVKNENIYYSAGQGMKFGLGITYVNKGVGFGVDAGYSMGFPTETMKSKEFSSYDSSWSTSTTKTSSSFLFISPNVRIEKTVGQMTSFAVLGGALALMPKSIQTSESEGYEYEAEMTYGIGLGGYGALGIKYALGGGLGIVGQVRVDQLSLKAKKSVIKKLTYDGHDELAEMTTREKETEYRDDDTDDNPSDPNSPEIEHAFTTPANSVSINVGIVYEFGGSGYGRRR